MTRAPPAHRPDWIEITQNLLAADRATIEVVQRRFRSILLTTTVTSVAGFVPLWFGVD